MSVDLTVIWAGIILFGVFAYVVMDGFDLGIGILFPAFDRAERGRAMNSIAPVWDGNETWLVLGGGGLLAAFPLAYAIILPGTYPLIIAMLLALVFRGVAFEYRWRDPSHQQWWDAAFTGGSLVAAMTQGMILGAVVQGIEVADRAYAGSWLDWLTPYTLLTGVGTVAGYALLGSTWLIWKLDGAGQHAAYHLAVGSAVATLALLGAVSICTPLLSQLYLARWFSLPSGLYTSAIPALTVILSLFLFRALRERKELLPFLLALGIFLAGMVGLAVTVWPYVVPESVTIWDAAAPAASQMFMLIGVAVTMPLIIFYTGWTYWIFRGKVGQNGYH